MKRDFDGTEPSFVKINRTLFSPLLPPSFSMDLFFQRDFNLLHFSQIYAQLTPRRGTAPFKGVRDKISLTTSPLVLASLLFTAHYLARLVPDVSISKFNGATAETMAIPGEILHGLVFHGVLFAREQASQSMRWFECLPVYNLENPTFCRGFLFPGALPVNCKADWLEYWLKHLTGILQVSPLYAMRHVKQAT